MTTKQKKLTILNKRERVARKRIVAIRKRQEKLLEQLNNTWETLYSIKREKNGL